MKQRSNKIIETYRNEFQRTEILIIVYNQVDNLFMNKVVILVFCLLCISFAHKGSKEEKKEINSIYQPFTDVPQINNEIITEQNSIESEKLPHEHQEGDDKDKKEQQIQQFNEMLGYGLVVGTMFLACMLFKTCGNHKRHLRQRRAVLAPASQNMMTHVPMLNKSIGSVDIKNRIEWHKMQIKRLEQEANQMEVIEQRIMQERQKEKKRQQQVLKGYYNQVELQETMQASPSHYSQPYYYPEYQYSGNIPFGRPIPKDNDSSFASEYPTI